MNPAQLADAVLEWLWRASWQSSVLVGLVLLVQTLLRRKLTPRWRSAFWGLVLIRLVMPLVPETPWSLFNCLRVERLHAATAPFLARTSAPRPTKNLDAIGTRASESAPGKPNEEGLASATEPGATPLTDGAANASARPIQPWAWRPTLVALWLVGVLALLGRVAWTYQSFTRRLSRWPVIQDPTLLALYEECRQTMGVRLPAALIATPEVDGPALFGCWRVRLLLPARLAAEFSREELRFVLLHELAHLRRGDVWLNWLITLLQALHWFNPVLWLGFTRMRTDRELACDALALAAAPDEAKRPYGRTIIRLLEGFARPSPAPGLVGIVEDKKQMENRMRMIATFKKSSGVPVVVVLLLVGLGAVALTDAQTQKSGVNARIAPPTTDDVIDSTNGLKYVVAKTIAGMNDVIEDDGTSLSPNGKFLLWGGRVVPLDGSPAFTLKELEGARIAAWSPDGRRIAFNSGSLGVMPVSLTTGRSTGAARMLIEETEDWFRGRIYWSADSEQVLYVKWNRRMQREAGSISLRDGRVNKSPDYADFGLRSPDGQRIAYSMPQDGIWEKPVSGGPARLARARSGGWLFDDPVLWTSDNQWVVSAVDGWRRGEIHFARLSDGQSLDVFPPEAAGAFVGKSEDGRNLCFYRSSFESRITAKVIPVSGAPAVRLGLPPGLSEIWDYSWSSDSGSLAVLGDDTEGQQLWSLPLTGGERVPFRMESLGTNLLWSYSLSRDVTKVLYLATPASGQRAQGTDLYIAPISLTEGRATGPATLALKGWQSPNPGVAERVGAWSPDGTRIAMPHKSDQGYALWILFADGQAPIQITQTPGPVGSSPQWSPDGRMIAFSETSADGQMLQVIAASGGATRTVLSTPKGQSVPFAWSSDSHELVVACDGSISSYAISDGRRRALVRLREAGCEIVLWLGWSPDGQRLAFYGGSRGDASRLYLFSPSAGKVTPLEESPPSAWDLVWSPDSKTISCAAEEAHRKRPAGVLRELEVAALLRKPPPVPEREPPVATLGPAPEPIAGPIFADNFDAGASKHWRFQDLPDQGQGPGRHAVENGQLMLSHARASLDGFDWVDYIVTLRLCVKEWPGSGLQSLAIATRAMPSRFGSGAMDRYCLGLFRNNNDPAYAWLGINYADGSKTLRHGELSRSPSTLVRDKWYTLAFEVRGPHLRGYLDGKLIAEATDTRLTQGKLWFGASSGITLFDDFSVRQLR